MSRPIWQVFANYFWLGMMDGMQYVAKIRALREAKGWSVSQLARRAGIPQRQADRLCKKVPASAISLAKLARALDVPIEWLLDDTSGLPAPSGGLVPANLADPRLLAMLRAALGQAFVDFGGTLSGLGEPKSRKGGRRRGGK